MTTKNIVALSITVGFIAYLHKQRSNNNPKIFVADKLPFNYNGFILPPFGIFVKRSEQNNKELIDHEKIHWKQFQREGLVPFILNYSKAAKEKGYDKNPYEIEARACEDEYCKLNYTECVRNGTAKTVHNPSFRT